MSGLESGCMDHGLQDPGSRSRLESLGPRKRLSPGEPALNPGGTLSLHVKERGSNTSQTDPC